MPTNEFASSTEGGVTPEPPTPAGPSQVEQSKPPYWLAVVALLAVNFGLSQLMDENSSFLLVIVRFAISVGVALLITTILRRLWRPRTPQPRAE